MNTKEKLNAFTLRKFPYRLNWLMTPKCNFNCVYCSTPSDNKLNYPVYNPEEIKSFFDKTGESWLILLTGGEPFLYPQFVNLAKKLTEKNHITITTNLSHKNVYKFADIIKPEKVLSISASFHRDELEKHNLIQEFINKARYLKNKGFEIFVNFVAYPPFLNQIAKDIEMFKKIGVESIVYGYRGYYDGKIYPENYTVSELEFLKRNSLDDTEEFIANNKLKFYGHKCDAGNKYFVMKPNGDLQRCFTLDKKIGNLFEGSIPLNAGKTTCIANQCEDYYFGRAAVSDKKSSFIKRLIDKSKYKSL